MMSEVTDEDLFGSSASDTDEDEFRKWPRVERTSRFSLVFFILGVSLIAPFTTFVCAAEDVLAGTNKPTGLVIISLTAPSCILKLVSLCFHQASYVARVFLAASFVLTGQLCTVFISHLGGRLAGVCLVAVGTGVGEVCLLMQAAKMLEEAALCSFVIGSGVGGVLGAASYVGLTVWATVDPRTAILVSAIWPPLFLLLFAVSRGNLHLVCNSQTSGLISRFEQRKFEVDCRLTSRWRERFLSVWQSCHHLLILFLVYFGEYMVLSAILTTLVFKGTGVGPEFVPRGHFEHYVLSTMVGEFLGRTFISMLRMVSPGFFCTSASVLAIFPLVETFFLLLATWCRLVPEVWIIWLLCFIQGTICGMIFSNSYHIIAKRFLSQHVTFTITLASILETTGILTAGLVGLHIEPLLLGHCTQHFGDRSDCLTRSTDPSFWEYGNQFNYDSRTALSL